ncbi:MAG TPA: glycosyltransferase family 9 protein [Ktedonobacteraceae bacterium]|jgi:lipopolysaccharide heptosyltransferase II|nr:glycosyltransferase family 9 protein [Ktedonobacteraceae bacterium]
MIDQRWQAARNILLVRLDNLGDVLLMTPAFHVIKQAIPHAHLTLLASPVGAQIGSLDPAIDDVLVYDAPWVDPWAQLVQDSAREQQMIAQLRTRRFDAAIIFTSFRQSSLPAAYLCYLADIPLRLAASVDGPGSLLTTRHEHPERMLHEVERGLDLVRALGIETIEQDMQLNVPADAKQAVMERLTCHHFTDRPLVIVHAGCSMPSRTYPWEMYAQVVELLVKQLDAYVALTGIANERDLVARICEKISPHYHAHLCPLAGSLSFAELCGLIQHADLTITNNTGPMHISAAVKTPVVALFALTNPPEQWRPWRVPQRLLYHEVPCRLCYHRRCPYQHDCLRLVAPQTVVDAARTLLNEVGLTPPDAALDKEGACE